MAGLGDITIFQNKAAPARSYMNDLLYGGQTLDNRAELLGLGGDYIYSANKFGQVNPIVLDNRGH